MSFEILPGHPASSCVIHVPHSSRSIPPDVRHQLLLDDAELATELDHMTDARTDELALAAADRAAPRPWLFVNRLSRLVVDPERFPDEREEMEQVGMGAVYTRTSHGSPLRDPAPELVPTYFDPYAEALADLVDARLEATGRVLLVDLHSYPVRALPYERHQQARRPAVCLGVDHLHTTPRLITRAREVFASVGDVAVDEPFVGTYVPLRHYGRNRRVASVMVELRRDAYLDDDGALSAARAERVVAALSALVDVDPD